MASSSHHSGGHRRHHRSKWSKLKHYLKKPNVVASIAAIVLCIVIVVVVILSGSRTPSASGDTASAADGTGISGGIILQPPDDPVSLVSDAVAVCRKGSNVNSDVNLDLQPYERDQHRLDQGAPVTIGFGLSDGVDAVGSPIVAVSKNADFSDKTEYRLGQYERSCDIYNLEPGTHYYYAVTCMLQDGSELCETGEFTTAQSTRLLKIDGAENIRDIGGLITYDGSTVKYGMLYRGSELDGAGDSRYDVSSEGIGEFLSLTGVKTDMDLRNPADLTFKKDILGDGVAHRYYSATSYGAIFDDKATVRKIFADLADPSSYPVYMHCTYGRDRTGTVCYLLEALLGVTEEYRSYDYKLSALIPYNYDYGMIGVVDEGLRLLYEGGSSQQRAEQFLLSCGVKQTELDSIRAILLEG